MARNKGKGITFHMDNEIVDRLDATLQPGQTRTDLMRQLILNHIDANGAMPTDALKAAIEAVLAKF